MSKDKIIILDKTQVHHLKNVLRLKPEDKVIVFDDKGNEYDSIVEKISPKSVMVKIKHKMQSNLHLNKTKITVACAIPKGARIDEIIDKLTQLGVDRIIPLETERVITRLNKHKQILRKERWNKIALSASQQSQRNFLPVIEPIKNIKEVLSNLNEYDLKLIPTLAGKRETLKDIFANTKAKNIFFLIGPEGDFTSEEVDLAKKVGCIAVSLGNLVLRVETAAVAVASFIRLYEDH